jgi:Rps23 Pro-64 3,4-dihydroxylase Tpa1-like proline 4-hydroxylase
MDHLEAVVEIKNIVDSNFIKRMIPFIEHMAKKNLNTMSGLDKETRNVNGYHLSFNNPTDLFYWNFVKKEIERIYIFYKSKFPKMKSNKINQIDLLKYSVGGKYEVHTDHFTNSPRHLSIILNLNDEYEGGDLIFTDQKEKEIKRLKLDKGSVVFFPSNFMYPHSIQPITKGTRYSIVSWLQ